MGATTLAILFYIFFGGITLLMHNGGNANE